VGGAPWRVHPGLFHLNGRGLEYIKLKMLKKSGVVGDSGGWVLPDEGRDAAGDRTPELRSTKKKGARPRPRRRLRKGMTRTGPTRRREAIGKALVGPVAREEALVLSVYQRLPWWKQANLESHK